MTLPLLAYFRNIAIKSPAQHTEHYGGDYRKQSYNYNRNDKSGADIRFRAAYFLVLLALVVLHPAHLRLLIFYMTQKICQLRRC